MTENQMMENVNEEGLVDAGTTRGRRGFAIASLVLGILSVLTLSGFLVGAILAVSFAIAARDKETRKIHGMAKAGLILGIVSIVLLVIGVGTFVGMLFAFVKALEEGCAAAGEDISKSLAGSLAGSILLLQGM